jgi:hypothetical protein
MDRYAVIKNVIRYLEHWDEKYVNNFSIEWDSSIPDDYIVIKIKR